MGQHKRNPTAILAKAGKLPEKVKKKSKKEVDKEIEKLLAQELLWLMLGGKAKRGVGVSE